MLEFNKYDEGYADGWDEGRSQGFQEGATEIGQSYEERISALWAELQTLNARVSYIEKHTGLVQGDN